MSKTKTNREFRKVPSLKFFYEISEDGRFLRNIKSKKYLKPYLDRDGYYRFWVSIKGKQRTCLAHSLVAECWLGPRPEGYEIDHIDRNRANNDWRNLRYVTHKENMANSDCSNRSNQAQRCKEVFGHQVQWGDTLFPSFRDCAKAIAEETGANYNTIRNYLRDRRHWVHGKPVRYGDFTETQRLHTKDSKE